VDVLSPSEKEPWIKMASPKANPKPYDTWRKDADRLAGRTGMYEALYEAAREIPETTTLFEVEPRRWWL
jgi:hypothetical protein